MFRHTAGNSNFKNQNKASRLVFFLTLFFFAFLLAFFSSGLILSISIFDLLHAFLLFFPFLLIGGFFCYILVSDKQKLRKKVLTFPANLPEKVDKDRRLFLKTLGSLGLGGLVYFLFTRKAEAIQFGGTGVPDPIGIEPLGGSQTTGSVTLTDANTWYQVPSSNQSNRFVSGEFELEPKETKNFHR